MPDHADQLGDHVLSGVASGPCSSYAARAATSPTRSLAHISPAHSENINFFGVITVDVEAELAKLDPAGWRPLRPAAPDLSLLL